VRHTGPADPLALIGITKSIYGLLTRTFQASFSRWNAESANLKIICLLVKCSLLAAV